MPIDNIQCKSCGSGNVIHVKDSLYACRHCGSTFNYVDPSRFTVEHKGQVTVVKYTDKLALLNRDLQDAQGQLGSLRQARVVAETTRGMVQTGVPVARIVTIIAGVLLALFAIAAGVNGWQGRDRFMYMAPAGMFAVLSAICLYAQSKIQVSLEQPDPQAQAQEQAQESALENRIRQLEGEILGCEEKIRNM